MASSLPFNLNIFFSSKNNVVLQVSDAKNLSFSLSSLPYLATCIFIFALCHAMLQIPTSLKEPHNL